jgi:hypothetical protein
VTLNHTTTITTTSITTTSITTTTLITTTTIITTIITLVASVGIVSWNAKTVAGGPPVVQGRRAIA